MTDAHASPHHGVSPADQVFGRSVAVVLGTVMLLAGVGLTLTSVLRPAGITLALSGLLIGLWGLFYAIPAAPDHPADHGHGHGPAAASH